MTPERYPVVSLSFAPDTPEYKGSRRKFWIRQTGELKPWLLKFPRPMTGEHWAEKITAELGHLVGVPCANVQLARSEWRPIVNSHRVGPSQCHDQSLATICESFLAVDSGPSTTQNENYHYYHGSEVLRMFMDDYDTTQRFQQRDHNIKNILSAMVQLMGIGTSRQALCSHEGLRVLASYVLLDGLVGNTDRHHDNWMINLIQNNGGSRIVIMPSFDHASSLGRELTDERRGRILRSNGMLNYLYRGRGGVFVDSRRRRALPPLRLAQLMCRWAPELMRDACNGVSRPADAALWEIIDQVPEESCLLWLRILLFRW